MSAAQVRVFDAGNFLGMAELPDERPVPQFIRVDGRVFARDDHDEYRDEFHAISPPDCRLVTVPGP